MGVQLFGTKPALVAPKRPPTAYALYIKDALPQERKPGEPVKDSFRRVALQFKHLPECERQVREWRLQLPVPPPSLRLGTARSSFRRRRRRRRPSKRTSPS